MAKKKTSKLGSYARRFLRWMLILFTASIIYSFFCLLFFPPVTITQASTIVPYGLKRDYVSWNKISPNVKLAAMASEDQLFVFHNGFDWNALEKSLDGGGKKKKRKKGSAASTISQQTAKNVFLWQGRGILKYIRKAPEFFYTFLIESIWSKQRIMEVYLNVIEMGPGIYGIEAAAQHYFKKSSAQLTKKEAALIIATLPNPKKYSANPASRAVNWKAGWIVRQMQRLERYPEIKTFIQNR